MSVADRHHAAELHHAFDSFNRLSRQLIDSYQTLETRVELLRDSFAERARIQRDQLDREQYAHRRLSRVLEALPAGVVVIDGAGVISECNPAAAALLGDNLVGRAWRDVVTNAFAPRADDGHDISLRDGRRVHLSTTPLGAEPGQVVLVTDVTRTRELQDHVHRYQRLSSLGEMAAGLAHQLRTPLSTVTLYLGMLKQPNASGVDRAAVIDKALARLRHIDALVRDMMLLARADHDAGEILAVSTVLDAVEQFSRPHVPADRVTLVISDECGGAEVRVQRDLLVSAMFNLIHNATQSIAARGTVTVRARAADGARVAFEVSDNGAGIPHAVQPRVGEPFFTTRDGGTGLGVAVVDAIARAHGGELSFESEVGAGTTFRLFLPALSRPHARTETR
jgi:two-component system sensor histidine kinase FlrB